MKLARREFLAAAVGVAAKAVGLGLVLLGGQALLRRPSLASGIIRPPGALPEKDFLAGCIRCYRCQDVCDAGAVQFFGEAAGKHFHTPYIDPARAACDLCMMCTQVCPTEVLAPLKPSQRSQVRMASVALEKDRCLSYKAKDLRYQQRLLRDLGVSAVEVEARAERRGICGECYMSCPQRGRAIKYEAGSFLAPLIYPDECVGCGLCEETCRMVLKGEPAIVTVPLRAVS